MESTQLMEIHPPVITPVIIITPASLQTKVWRKECEWYNNGKHNECELYQRNIINTITSTILAKSSVRINVCDYRMQSNPTPMKRVDGFDWTEDFDGFIQLKELDYYFNLKMVCGAGGAQTRTLREVYHFIKSQLEHLLISPESHSVYFVNILDGDASHKVMSKFNYLIELCKYNEIKNRVYIGDLHGFHQWFLKQ
jgi:hypothetical protein